MKAVILNTDNSVVRQGLDRAFKTDVLDLRDLRPGLQFYADYGARDAFSRRAAAALSGSAVRLLGSGDFHHLTLMILEQFAAPFFLLVFDNHSDCSFLGPTYHCGNWLYHAARLPRCRKVLHAGSTEKQGILGRAAGIGRLLGKGALARITGRELAAQDGVERFRQILALHNPDRAPVYVSVDKDVLRQEEAPGDWDNGVMTLSRLSALLDHVVRTCEVRGADITGEKGGRFPYRGRPLKNMLSLIEHRVSKDATPTAAADEKQAAVNRALLDILGADHVD